MVQKFLTKTTYSKFSQKMWIQVTVVKRSGVVIRGSPLSTRVPLSQNQPLPHPAHGSPVRRDCLHNWINPKKKRNFWAKSGRQRFAKFHWNVCFGRQNTNQPNSIRMKISPGTLAWEVAKNEAEAFGISKSPPFCIGERGDFKPTNASLWVEQIFHEIVILEPHPNSFFPRKNTFWIGCGQTAQCIFS